MRGYRHVHGGGHQLHASELWGAAVTALLHIHGKGILIALHRVTCNANEQCIKILVNFIDSNSINHQ